MELYKDNEQPIVEDGVQINSGQLFDRPRIISGILEGCSINSGGKTSARIEIYPAYDPTIGIVQYNDAGEQTLKTILSGTDAGDIVLGNYTGGNGALWDNSDSKFYIKGSITILNPGDINTSSLNNDAGWTLGATWGTNLGNIPTTLQAPSGSGLFLSSTHLGYYSSGAWKTYMDSSGNFILGDVIGGGKGMSWNQIAASLSVVGEINATSGKFGTSTNYWSVGSTGLTAVSASGDVLIKYGKTDFGQDSTAGFILGYDYSATASKFEIGSSTSKIFKYDGTDLSLTGGTITGGVLQTATTGGRIKIDGANNALYFLNDDVINGYISQTISATGFSVDISTYDDDAYVSVYQSSTSSTVSLYATTAIYLESNVSVVGKFQLPVGTNLY